MAFAPSLELVKPIRGPQVDLQPGKVHALLFFPGRPAPPAKGKKKGAPTEEAAAAVPPPTPEEELARYQVYEAATACAEAHLSDVTFIGVAVNGAPDKTTEMLNADFLHPESGELLRIGFGFVSVDQGGATKAMYKAQSTADHVAAFDDAVTLVIVDKLGKIIAAFGCTAQGTSVFGSVEELLKVEVAKKVKH